MQMSLVQWSLAVGATGLQIALMYVLTKKKLKSSFPFFFNYAALGLAALALILVAGPHLAAKTYFFAYWTMSALLMMLTFVVLYEVFVNVLKPYSALIDLGKLLFIWAGTFLLIASTLTAVATAGHHADRLCAAIMMLERSVQLMQCGMLLLFLLFENRLGLSWRSHGMSIALGLGVTAALDLVSNIVGSRYPSVAGGLETLSTVTYFGMWAFWLVTFMLPEPQRQTAKDSPSRIILQRWNEALTGYGYGDVAYATDSFLPGVEKTVDRVMARKMVH